MQQLQHSFLQPQHSLLQPQPSLLQLPQLLYYSSSYSFATDKVVGHVIQARNAGQDDVNYDDFIQIQ